MEKMRNIDNEKKWLIKSGIGMIYWVLIAITLWYYLGAKLLSDIFLVDL